MAVYSKKLAAGQTGGGGDELVFTAPPLGVIVVRDVTLVVSGSGATLLQMYTISGLVRSYIQSIVSPVRAQSYQLSCRHVLDPGEELWINDYAAATYYRICGYLLGG
jgi:archaeosine-15-forming tRNA-guanine transglycosylase